MMGDRACWSCLATDAQEHMYFRYMVNPIVGIG